MNLTPLLKITLLCGTLLTGIGDLHGAVAIRRDQYGDPLPLGAVARLGMNRLRHHGPVNTVLFTPYGTLLSLGWDHALCVWDPRTGKEHRRFRVGLGQEISDFTLSPDGRCLALSLYDQGQQRRLLHIVDYATGRLIARCEMTMRDVRTLAFSPDGNLLAGGSWGSPLQIQVWDAATGKSMRELDSQAQFTERLAFSPDGKRLVVGSSKSGIHLLDVATGKQVQGMAGAGKCFDFAPGGEHLASGGRFDGAVTIREVSTGRTVRILDTANRMIQSVLYSPDGKLLATAGSLKTSAVETDPVQEQPQLVELWDTITGKQVARIPAQSGWVCGLAFSPDGKLLATAGRDYVVRIWDVATGKESVAFQGHHAGLCRLAFSPDGKLLASAGRDHTIRIWDTATWQERGQLSGHACPLITGLTFSPDGTQLLSADHDGRIRVWDVTRCTLVRELAHFRDLITAIGFSPDGKRLVILGLNCAVRMLDMPGGKETQAQQGFVSGNFATLASNGQRAAIPRDPFVHLLDLRSDPPKRLSVRAAAIVYAVALTPDGRWLATGVANKFLTLQDAETGRQVHSWSIEGEPANLQFTRDGRTLVVSMKSAEGPMLTSWETISGKARQWWLSGHLVHTMAVSPDGRWLLSGGEDGTILVWPAPFATLSPRMKLTPADLATLWETMAEEDASMAYDAQRRLLSDPTTAVAFLRDRVQPAAAIDLKRLQQAILELDSADFNVRAQAEKVLLEMGEQALPHLKAAIGGRVTDYVRRQLTVLIAQLEGPPSPQTIRVHRALEVMEHAATPEALQHLEKLSQGAKDAWLSKEAQVVRDRLASRPKPSKPS